jgi:hypothetical protein
MDQFRLLKAEVPINAIGATYVLVHAWLSVPLTWTWEYHILVSKPTPRVISMSYSFSHDPDVQLLGEGFVRQDAVRLAEERIEKLIIEEIGISQALDLIKDIKLIPMPHTPMSLVTQQKFMAELSSIRANTKSDELRRWLEMVLSRDAW